MSEKATSGLLAGAGLIVTSLLWGAMIPMTHALATRYLDPFFISAIRYLIPAPLLIVMAFIFDRASPFRAPVPWLLVIRLGTAMGLFSICYTIGVMMSEPVRAAITMSCSPLVAAAMTRAMMRVPLARGFWPAAIAAIIGAALVALDAARPKAGSMGSDYPYVGELLLVFAMILWSWYSLRVQSWLAPRGFSNMRATCLTTLVGGICICSLFLVMAAAGPGHVPTEIPPLPAIGMLLWLGLGGAGLAILFWNYGVSHVGVPVATLYSSLAPVFAVMVSAIFFGSGFTLQQIAGGILILAGVVRMQWLGMKAARETAARQKMV